MNVPFSQWLKHRRKALDLTQEALAERVGCSLVTIKKIESGARRPSRQIAELLALHLGISPEEQTDFVQFARTGVQTAALSRHLPSPQTPNNIPTPPTPLIGREDDIAAILRLLLRDSTHLLTLTGAPGIGKTRLAMQVAAQALDEFVDGVCFVALAPITDTYLVTTTIANALGVQETGPQTPLERLKTFLSHKQTLLVLDNFEQILPTAPQIAELLSACPWLKILVTSRSPLRIRQERQFPVSPLALPDLVHMPDVETVTHYSAVILFLERAQAVKPDFLVTPENVSTVTSIVTRLDGLPLAIELISARVKLLPPATLLERLHGRLMLQSDGLRDIEPRHRTLNAAIDWSYQLLNPDEQTLFWRLSVFVGGWTLESAESVCVGDERAQGLAPLQINILDGLASLLDKNLVKRDHHESRFTMLETIREYALEKLADSGESDNLRQRHAEYFTTFAERAEAELHQADYALWLAILEMEHENFRAALAWDQAGLRLAVALHEFWQRRGHLNEGRRWLEVTLARPAIVPLTDAYRTLQAKALDRLAVFAVWHGDLGTALPRYEESLALFREIGNLAGVAESTRGIGMLYQLRGDHERAGALLEESLAAFREIENKSGIAWGYFFLGTLAYTQNSVQRAAGLWDESLIQMRANEDSWGIATVLNHLAMSASDLGIYRQADHYLKESLTRLQELGERWQTVLALEVVAGLTVVREQPNFVRAARIFGVAEGLREAFSSPMLPIYKDRYQRSITALRAQLDDSALAAAWAEGRAMTLEQAIADALEA